MESSDELTSWSNLPSDLLCRVLCFLPLQTLFRLRSVCKQWRSFPFSLLFAESAAPSSPVLHHFWLFAFRLLARKVNEQRTTTYKATTYTYSIAYDREMMGSSGCALQLPLGRGSDHSLQKRYEVLGALSGPLITFLETGNIDIVASTNGLLLLTLRLSKVHDHEENNLKLFVYNPISKDMRALPTTRWAPQQLSMIPYRDGNECSGYRIYSLGRSYRPGTTYLLYSIEVFDSLQAHNGWHFVSHVRANLGGMYPGSETPLMGYVNSKSIGNGLGFLYWMPSLEHKSENGLHTELSSCHMSTGFLYGLPGLPFKTTFADMWPCASGLMLVCGVAGGDDLSCTCGVEIWELLQGEEGPVEDDHFYGVKRLPQGTHWQPCDRMAHDIWDLLTCMSNCRVACVVSIPLVFVIAENQEECMVVYDTNDKTWKLTQFWPLLKTLFEDAHPQYFRVYPWIVTFTPNADSFV